MNIRLAASNGFYNMTYELGEKIMQGVMLS